jgi:hypothetical protein
MATKRPLVERLRRCIKLRNRELGIDAAIKAGLGVLFSLVTFGCVFWFSWVIGFAIAGYLGMRPWHLALGVTALFAMAATWSAWHRVNPLAGLQPLTDQELILTLISQAIPGVLYFSPRHAVAGAALLLLGGPANVVSALGIWAHRLRADDRLLGEAASVLTLCGEGCPVKQLPHLHAALLLRRLALVKPMPNGNSTSLAVTEKGRKLVV